MSRVFSRIQVTAAWLSGDITTVHLNPGPIAAFSTSCALWRSISAVGSPTTIETTTAVRTRTVEMRCFMDCAIVAAASAGNVTRRI